MELTFGTLASENKTRTVRNTRIKLATKCIPYSSFSLRLAQPQLFRTPYRGRGLTKASRQRYPAHVLHLSVMPKDWSLS